MMIFFIIPNLPLNEGNDNDSESQINEPSGSCSDDNILIRNKIIVIPNNDDTSHSRPSTYAASSSSCNLPIGLYTSPEKNKIIKVSCANCDRRTN
jgi:hypothetical protein